MATIKIGGKDVILPIINVKVMRRVIPLVETMQGVQRAKGVDVDLLMTLTLKTLATWLVGYPKQDASLSREEQDKLVDALVAAKAEELEEEMAAAEFASLAPDLKAAMAEQGFFKSGEQKAPGPVAPPEA